MKSLNFNPCFYLNKPKTRDPSLSIKRNYDNYYLALLKREEVLKLIKILLLLSKHNEKIQKMRLILRARNLKKWDNVKNEVLELRRKIKESRLQNLSSRLTQKALIRFIKSALKLEVE